MINARIGVLVAGMVLAGSAMMGQANATEISGAGFNTLKHKPLLLKKHVQKATFAVGTSAIYSRANLLPKTERFVHPVVATNAIYGNGGNICGISGLGHRSSCF